MLKERKLTNIDIIEAPIVRSYLHHLKTAHNIKDTPDTVFDLISLSQSYSESSPEYIKAIKLTIEWFNSRLKNYFTYFEDLDPKIIYVFIVLLLEATGKQELIEKLLKELVDRGHIDILSVNENILSEVKNEILNSTYEYFKNKYSYIHHYDSNIELLIRSKLGKLLNYDVFSNKFELVFGSVVKLQASKLENEFLN